MGAIVKTGIKTNKTNIKSTFSVLGLLLVYRLFNCFSHIPSLLTFNKLGSERLELSQISPLDPKSSASTNFATSPY